MKAGAKKLILIADDDPDLRRVFESRCRQIGFDVVTTDCAVTALNIAHDRKPAVICLDVELPGGNGLAAAEMLQSDERFSATPLVIITGSVNCEIEKRCHQLSTYFIPKIDTWNRLCTLLRELFDLGDVVSDTSEENSESIGAVHG